MKYHSAPLRQLGCLLIAALPIGIAAAGPVFGFQNITNNKLTDAAIGEDQLTVELIDFGGGQVEFLFRNSGPEASSIARIYFDDNASVLSTPMGFTDIVGNVHFSQFASPPDLPGGDEVGFNVTSGLLADSDPPPVHNGINPGEQLGVTLLGNYTDTLNALNSGDLRIGIHVIGFAGGGSESFITNGGKTPPGIVPAPGAAGLVLTGMGSLLAARRKLR